MNHTLRSIIDEELQKAYERGVNDEHERTQWNGIHTCNKDCKKLVCASIREAILKEREECAKLCDAAQLFGNNDERWSAKCCSEAIRARGQS